MKNRLYLVLTFSLLLSMLSAHVFAGIPINEKAGPQQEIRAKKKSNKRVSKLKQKIVKKIKKRDVDEGGGKAAAIVFAILIPFVGVAIYQDRIGKDFWITLALTVLGFVPGMIYALSIVLKRLK